MDFVHRVPIALKLAFAQQVTGVNHMKKMTQNYLTKINQDEIFASIGIITPKYLEKNF